MLLRLAAPALFGLTQMLAPARSSSGELGTFSMRTLPEVNQDGSSASIEFRFRYDGPSAVKASVESLPGERLFHFVSIEAEVFPDYDSDPFVDCPAPQKRIFIDDAGVGYRTLAPSSELVQKIDLFSLYGNLDQILSKCDLVVFWSHRVHLRGAYDTPRLAGAVVFPMSLQDLSESPRVL